MLPGRGNIKKKKKNIFRNAHAVHVVKKKIKASNNNCYFYY